MKVICIGRNYVEHIEELGNEKPERPVIFLKPDSSIILNNKPFFLPDILGEVHHEVEILVKINKVGKSIPVKFASTYYDKIGLGIDFTARELQRYAKSKGLPWDLAKGFDGSAPISRFISKKEFGDGPIPFHLELNGNVVQKSDTSLMLYPIPEIISYVSQFITLKIGDIIFTGTPKGVGPVKIGDHLRGYVGDQKMLDFHVR